MTITNDAETREIPKNLVMKSERWFFSNITQNLGNATLNVINKNTILWRRAGPLSCYDVHASSEHGLQQRVYPFPKSFSISSGAIDELIDRLLDCCNDYSTIVTECACIVQPKKLKNS